MSETLVTSSSIAREVSRYYWPNWLAVAREARVHGKFGDPTRLPAKSSATIAMRRVTKLAAATTPLTEGVTPSGSSFTISEITETVKQYGDFISITDAITKVHEDPVLTQISVEQGEQLADTLDTLDREVLNAGTSVIYGNGVSRSAVNTIIATNELDTAIRLLKGQNAKVMEPPVPAGVNIATSGLRKAFVAIVHPDLEHTLEGLTGFVPINQYPGQSFIMEHEIGYYKDIRFVMSTKSKIFPGAGAAGGSNVKETGGNADVYTVVILGRNAYANIVLSQGNSEMIIKQLGSAGAADPLNQRGTMGWKIWYASKIKNDAFMTRIEVAATDAI